MTNALTVRGSRGPGRHFSSPEVLVPTLQQVSPGLRCLAAALLMAGVALSAPRAYAHGDVAHPAADEASVDRTQQVWGVAAGPSTAGTVVEMRMMDSMRFDPEHLQVNEGETIVFRVTNAGKMMHEFVLGTSETLAEHAALMLQFPEMEHDEPYMAHVPPGETRELRWTFNRAGRFEYACLIAGHFQAGMTGSIEVN